MRQQMHRQSSSISNHYQSLPAAALVKFEDNYIQPISLCMCSSILIDSGENTIVHLLPTWDIRVAQSRLHLEELHAAHQTQNEELRRQVGRLLPYQRRRYQTSCREPVTLLTMGGTTHRQIMLFEGVDRLAMDWWRVEIVRRSSSTRGPDLNRKSRRLSYTAGHVAHEYYYGNSIPAMLLCLIPTQRILATHLVFNRDRSRSASLDGSYCIPPCSITQLRKSRSCRRVDSDDQGRQGFARRKLLAWHGAIQPGRGPQRDSRQDMWQSFRPGTCWG
eukprot:284815789_2